MIINEILDTLTGLRNEYNSGGNDFSKWYDVPLLIIEDSGSSYVSDPVILEPVFTLSTNVLKGS